MGKCEEFRKIYIEREGESKYKITKRERKTHVEHTHRGTPEMTPSMAQLFGRAQNQKSSSQLIYTEQLVYFFFFKGEFIHRWVAMKSARFVQPLDPFSHVYCLFI